MNSILDLGGDPPSEQEILAIKQDARATFTVWGKRTLYAGIALALSCAAVVPFAKGHSLHAHAEPFGRLFVYLSMGLLVVLVICGGIALNSWLYVRDLEKSDR